MATRIARPFMRANAIPPDLIGLPKKESALDPASMLPIVNYII